MHNKITKYFYKRQLPLPLLYNNLRRRDTASFTSYTVPVTVTTFFICLSRGRNGGMRQLLSHFVTSFDPWQHSMPFLSSNTFTVTSVRCKYLALSHFGISLFKYPSLSVFNLMTAAQSLTVTSAFIATR